LRLRVTPSYMLTVQEPLPHVSLAWTPGDEASRLQPWLKTVSHEPITLKVCNVSAASRGAGSAAAASWDVLPTRAAAEQLPLDGGACLLVWNYTDACS
jgi:hypothetical protein